MDALLPSAYAFLLVLLRASGLLVAMPLTGSRLIPNQAKIVLVASLSLTAYLAAGEPRVDVPASIGGLLSASLWETAFGLATGAMVRVALDGAVMAGHIAGTHMGLSASSMFDPIHGVQSDVVAEFLNMVTVGLAVAVGLHRDAVVWLARSVQRFPPGAAPHDLRALATRVTTECIDALALGMRLSFPFLAAVSFGYIVLGLVGRAAQQLNINTVSFSITILAGGLALYMAAPSVAELAVRAAVSVLERGP